MHGRIQCDSLTRAELIRMAMDSQLEHVPLPVSAEVSALWGSM